MDTLANYIKTATVRAKGANVSGRNVLEMARASSAQALKEARKANRFLVLQKLHNLEAESAGAFFPLSQIASSDVPNRYLRAAVGGLYRLGLITVREGKYGLTRTGRNIFNAVKAAHVPNQRAGRR